MTTLAVVGAGTVLSGEIDAPVVADADTVVTEDGVVTAVGRRSADPAIDESVRRAEVVVDAGGATVAPGLIDSHCHVVLGDYTPRQRTVGFLESYTHGGITSVVSAGEIHAPGRPHDPLAVKALALAARACFANFSPNGMRVHAGTVILEPGLSDGDFAELASGGVRLAKFGFGDYKDPRDGAREVRGAQAHGIRVMSHCGGASVPGSRPIDAETLLVLRPDVYGHVNGGPTALRADGVRRLVDDTDGTLQLVQAGNLRSSLEILDVARALGALARVVVGSDTPTGTGVMPLGVVKTLAELCSLGGLDGATAWALATGNNARAFGIPGGRLAAGEVADLVVMDAPWGSVAESACDALALGDVPGVSAVVIDGKVRVLRSRNTPAAARQVLVTPPIELGGE
ncbi:MAG: amidohydrolase family protein [Acidimicrobiales bacterium]